MGGYVVWTTCFCTTAKMKNKTLQLKNSYKENGQIIMNRLIKLQSIFGYVGRTICTIAQLKYSHVLVQISDVKITYIIEYSITHGPLHGLNYLCNCKRKIKWKTWRKTYKSIWSDLQDHLTHLRNKRVACDGYLITSPAMEGRTRIANKLRTNVS